MDKDRLEWLKKNLDHCDYVHVGQWGEPGVDIEGDVLDLIEEVERLTKRGKRAREIIEDHCRVEDDEGAAMCPACCQFIHKTGCYIKKWLEGKP